MIEDLATKWLASMVSVSVQFAVFAGLAAGLVLAMRSLSPKLAYVVWLSVLARLVIPFGISLPFGVLPASTPLPQQIIGIEQTAVSRQLSGSAAAPRQDSSRAHPSAFEAPVESVLFIGWAGIVLALAIAQLGRGIRNGVRMRSTLLELPLPLARRLELLREELGYKRPVRAFGVSDESVNGPVIQGFVRPRLLLPESLLRWSPEELDPVLIHEIVHLKRWDPAARALQNLLQIVYFFHPLVWWVNGRLRDARELACDDAVVERLAGNKRVYMKSLVRLVADRASGLLSPELGMAAARRPLAHRLRRMLASSYDYRPRLGTLSRACLVAGWIVAAALSTVHAAPSRGHAQAHRVSPLIRARLVWSGGSFASSLDELEGAKKVELGGDFTRGRPTTPVKPDAAALAANEPELFARLEKLGHLSARLIVGTDGRVLRVQFRDLADPSLQKPFRDVLEAARFEPVVHYQRGPVMVAVDVDYWINPKEEPRSLYEEGQTFVGEEVAEIVRVFSVGDGGDAAPLQARFPRYLALVDKGEVPSLPAGNEESIVPYSLSIDAGGNVISVTPFPEPHLRAERRPADPGLDPATPALMEYLQSFRFAPPALTDGTPVRVAAMVDLRVSKDGVEVATRAAGTDEELDRRFAEVYRLEDGRSLDLLPPPYPPERMLFYRTGSPGQARSIPRGPTRMIVVWKDGRPTYGGSCFGCADVPTLLVNLGIRRDAVRMDDDLQNLRIEADLVERDGASREELLSDLTDVLREKFGLDLRFDVATEPIRTLVLRGSIGTVAPDPARNGQRVLHVFTDQKNEDPWEGAGGGPFSDMQILVRLLSSQLAMPVTDETTVPPLSSFYVQIHDSAYGTRRFDLLIRNLEAQTDLDVALEVRVQDVVRVVANER